jgi:hypothetical protein
MDIGFGRTITSSAILLWALAAGSCGRTPPTDTAARAVVYLAALTPEVVRVLSLEVTGPGINHPLFANFPVDTTATPPMASGIMSVPAGSARRLVLLAVDIGGSVTHRADTTMSLSPGEQHVVLEMRAVETTLGITVTFPPD